VTFALQVRLAGLRPHCEGCTGVKGRETIEIDHPPGEEIQWDWFERRNAPWGGTAYVLLGTLSHSGRTRGVLSESMDQAHLIESMDQVMRRLGGTARAWRTDRLATVIVPGTADVQKSFAPVAKHYGAVVIPCPPRRGNRKGAVECGVKFCCGRWWRTMTGATMADAQVSLDRFWSTTGDSRLRPPGRYLDPCRATEDESRPRWPTVGELAETEVLLALPAAPYPATIEVQATPDDKASVAFRGNRYSVPPGLGETVLTLRHRLGTASLEIFSPSGTELVSHRLARRGAGAVIRTEAHRASGSGRSGRAGPAASGVWQRTVSRLRRHGRDHRLGIRKSYRGIGMTETSKYQKLRAHLAFLRMTAAAEALPEALDHAIKAKLSHQDFLERLLSVEVASVDERRRVSLARFASLPSPFTLDDFDFSAQPSVDKKTIDDLATLRFTEDATNVLFIGPPGVGKTMLAVGLGHQAVAAGMRTYYTTAADLAARCHRAALEGRWATTMRFYAGPRLLIIDEVGYLPLPAEAAAALFQVVSQRYLKGSIALTTNLGIASWANVFNDDPMIAGAMLDRLLHRSVVLNIDGDSYRMRSHRARAEAARRAVAGAPGQHAKGVAADS
jgi:DNA replication protein DnaC